MGPFVLDEKYFVEDKEDLKPLDFGSCCMFSLTRMCVLLDLL